jgi:hypothetical protein
MLGFKRDGEIVQVYVRSWSTVMRVPSDRGLLFFKASGPPQAMEVAIVNLLSKWRTDVVAPLASDERLAWMLMRDGGTRLRELPQNTDVEMWTRVVAEYADLQRTVAEHVDELLAAGARDFRLERLPDLYTALLDSDLVKGEVEPSEHRQLVVWRAELEDLCAQLSSHGVPETIEHNDLHTANVFLNDGRVLFFDWGDSSISHPFHSMATTLRVFAQTLDVGIDDPIVVRVRDAYLGEFGDVNALLEPFELAQRTVVVTKALTFAPFVRAMPPPFRERYGDTVANVLRRLLGA